jgi:glycosyltransferase involved in cell wall biosynthesis
MRIVFVGPFAMQPKRTMAVRALPLAKALAQRGHDVQLLLPPWDCPEDAGRAYDDAGVHIRNARLPPPFPLLGHALLTWRLLQPILEQPPDVVHCFKPKSYSGLSAWALWQLKRLGAVRTRLVVDADDWEGAGGWNELEDYTWTQRRFFAWQERWGLTHCDALTVASRALQTIAWSLGSRPATVHYLPNGAWPRDQTASTAEVAALREKYGLGDAPVALLYTRFFEYDLQRALAVMQGVLEQVPQAQWLVVGKGLFGEEERFLAMASEGSIGRHVHYAGWVPPQQLPAHFTLAQAAIYPFDDTLVNRCKCAVKLIDLLAAGVPVAAEAVGQNREYIEDGISGLLVHPGDVEAFVAGVVRLLRDREFAGQLARSARKRIQCDFTWHRLAVIAERAYGA